MMTFARQQRLLAALIVEAERDIREMEGQDLEHEEALRTKAALQNCRSLLASIHEDIERQRKERKANMLVQE